MSRHHRPVAGYGFATILAGAFFVAWLFQLGGSAEFQLLALPGEGAVSNLGVGLAIFAVILINSLCVAGETAVGLLKPLHVRHVREEDETRGEKLQSLLQDRARYQAACKLGSDLARLAIMLLVLLLAPSVIAAFAEQFGWSRTYLNTLVAAVALMIPIGLANLVGELVPKSYAALHPHRVALRLGGYIKTLSLVLSLPAGVVTGIANLFTARFGGKASLSLANQTEEEIKTLVETAEESGEIERDERELLHSVFEFTDTVAREVMTPRVDIDAMPVSSKPEEVAEVIRGSGHSRIPLFEGTDDQIVGIIHAKDLFIAMLNGKSLNLRTLMRPALFVPENKNLHELLGEMRATRSQLAVVQDEFGGTSGIVTTEDIVEELVGDIRDEYDVDEQEITQEGSCWIVDGKSHIDEVNDAVGSSFESDEFDSIGGMVFGLIGRQPVEGQQIESSGYRFTVIKTDGRRILKLAICPCDSEPQMVELPE